MIVILAFKKSQRKSAKLFYKILSKCVQLWTGSQYFHVALIIDGKWITSDTEKGVIIEEYGFDDDTYDYFNLDVPEFTSKSNEIFSKYVHNQIHSGYDWIGIIFSEFLKLRWESKSKWYCSEFVVKMLQIIGCYEAIDSSTLVSPSELHKILKHRLVLYNK